MIPPDLLDRAHHGDRRALARVISQIEAQPDLYKDHERGAAGVIGITGPPGVGKSTLVGCLIDVMRERGDQVAVLAVDPSSPVTGGSLLGDRIRIQDSVDDEGVYIRSMAARGHLGGLSLSAGPVISLLSHAGFNYVLVETVGVGQSEVEVMDVVDVVALVLAPGWGDQIQADKAGIVEIADLFVINKADRDGVEVVHRALTEVANSATQDRPIVVTSASDGEGIITLLDTLDELLAKSAP